MYGGGKNRLFLVCMLFSQDNWHGAFLVETLFAERPVQSGVTLKKCGMGPRHCFGLQMKTCRRK